MVPDSIATFMGARYGQHFLIDQREIAAIIERFAPAPSDRVIELGAGRGALTRVLAGRPAALAAIEIDPDLARRLSAGLGAPLLELGSVGTAVGSTMGPASGSGERVWIVRGDALEASYESLAGLLGALPSERLRVIGNLPYGVATALVQRMVAARSFVRDALVMVQKEVADRMTAAPRSKSYGPLAVLLALTSERSLERTIRPGAFRPPPKVLSALVHLKFRPVSPSPGHDAREARLMTVVKAAFAERRKKLAAPLARRLGIERPRMEALLDLCGVPADARAEQLAPETFLELASQIDIPAAPDSGRQRDPTRL